MAKISELLKNIGGYLTVGEVEAYGNEGIVLTIKEALSKVPIGEKGEEKPIISFEEHAKLLIINKTRGEQLSDLFGAETDPLGKQVRIVVENAKIGNRRQPMICIREV